MRRWYFASAAVLGLAALAVLGGKLFSDDKADANAPAGSKIAKSKIDKVVVYPNSALVTREVDVPEGNGLAELVVAPMPEQIIPSTMFSEAAEGIRRTAQLASATAHLVQCYGCLRATPSALPKRSTRRTKD